MTSNICSIKLGQVTAVQEPPIPDTDPSAGEPGFPQVDLAFMQVAVEQAAAEGAGSLSESELIDQVQQIESLQNSLAALQASRIRAFARAHVGARIAAGVLGPDKLDRAVAAQIGLACRVSPTEARTRVRTARDLHEGFDRVRALFVAGELSRDKVAADRPAQPAPGRDPRPRPRPARPAGHHQRPHVAAAAADPGRDHPRWRVPATLLHRAARRTAHSTRPQPVHRALLRCAGTTPRPHRPRRRRRTHRTRQRPRHLRVPQPRPRATRMDRPTHARGRPHHDTHRAHLPRTRGST